MECSVDFCLDASTVRQAEAEEINRAKDMMQKELEKFSERQGIEVISDIREGDPVAEILKEQDERGVDLIVMPSHRKKGILDRLMGPISEKVMAESKSPVLLVHH
jgi:nucleotide-binding universal stress UspA family protein